MHPRISVSAVSSYRNPLAHDLALWRSLGVRRVGLTMAKLEGPGLDTGIRMVRDAGLEVTNVITFGPSLQHPESWAERLACVEQALDAVAALDAGHLVLTTGCGGRLSWEAALACFRSFLEPVQPRLGRVIVEHTNALRTDVSFLHTLRDAVDAARHLGVGVLCELNACWAERAIDATLRNGVDVIRLVQVSDYAIGTHDTPNRLVPGDGDIPLERLITTLLDAGYGGDFDLELIGPRIEAEGYASAIRRGVERLTALLEQGGAHG